MESFFGLRSLPGGHALHLVGHDHDSATVGDARCIQRRDESCRVELMDGEGDDTGQAIRGLETKYAIVAACSLCRSSTLRLKLKVIDDGALWRERGFPCRRWVD